MNTCCNNIYPDEDLRRWEVGCSVPYYTKAEIDEKLENIDISGDCISSGDVQNMIDASVEPIEGSVEALSGTVGELSAGMENKAEKSEIPDMSKYWTSAQTQSWVNSKDYVTELKPIYGFYGDPLYLEQGYGRHNSVHIGSDDVIVEIRTNQSGNDDSIMPHSLKPIAGRGEYDHNRRWVNGLFTYDGFAIGRWNDYNEIYDESEDRYLLPYFSIGNGTDDNNRHNIFTVLENGKVVLEDGRILQNWLSEVDDVASRAASDVANKQDTLESGWNIKTINGQSLLGEGNITISGGGSADLSQYWTSAQTQNAIDAATQGKADASNVYTITETDYLLNDLSQRKADQSNTYTKTEVNNIVNNKFWCGTQAQYDALTTKGPNVLYLIHE